MTEWLEKNKMQAGLDVLKGFLFAIICSVAFWCTDVRQTADNLVQDHFNWVSAENFVRKIFTYFSVTASLTQQDDVVIVNIDPACAQWAKQSVLQEKWPWGPDIFSDLNLTLKQWGVKSIGYNFLLATDYDNDRQRARMQALGARLRNEWENRHVVLGMLLSSSGKENHVGKHDRFNLNAHIFANIDKPENLYLKRATNNSLKGTFPVETWRHLYNSMGNTAISPDTDGIYRRVRPFAVFDRMLVPTLGISTVLAGDSGKAIRIGKDSLTIGDRTIHLDGEGNLVLKFSRDSEIRQYNARDILAIPFLEKEGLGDLARQRVPADYFRGKHVLVRYSGADTPDTIATPFTATSDATSFHAQVMLNIIHGTALSVLPPLHTIVFLLLYLVVVSVVCAKLPRLLWCGALVLVLAMPITIGFVFYVVANLAIPVATLTIPALCGAVLTFFLRFFHEWQRRQSVQRAFNCYVNPVISEQILQDPQKLELGGKENEITVLFADLANFTHISSNRPPRETISFLNEYLQEMSTIIVDEGGCIDKYIGDAIVAFWNAPIAQPDHADRAVRAALRCQAKVGELRQHFKEKYKIILNSRIGIHTGKAIVGNVGSQQKLDYTVIGGTVNLASRLEGANKYFGTKVLVTEATVAALTMPNLEFMDLGRIQVMGQHDSVRVYEPCPSHNREQLSAFNAAMKLFSLGRFEQAQRQFQQCAGIPAIQTMQWYCQRYLAGHRKWQGYIELDAK